MPEGSPLSVWTERQTKALQRALDERERRCAAVCDMRRCRMDGQNPRRLQLNASSLSCPYYPQCCREEVVVQDTVPQEGVELVFDEARQFGCSADIGVRDAAYRVLLHQAVQRCPLEVVPVAREPGAIRHPLGLPV